MQLLPSWLRPNVADGVYDDLKRKRQTTNASYDKHAKPLTDFLVAESVRLQPANPKAPWEKGSCAIKVASHSFLIETENENLTESQIHSLSSQKGTRSASNHTTQWQGSSSLWCCRSSSSNKCHSKHHCFSYGSRNLLALQHDLHKKSNDVCIKARSTQASLLFKGLVTEHSSGK